MKFTIERQVLIRMTEQAHGRSRSKKSREASIKLAACAARVFVAGSAATAGYEALVFSDGECFIPAKNLLAVLRTYPNQTNLTITVDARGLHIDQFTMPVTGFAPQSTPPGQFRVFPVTDLRVLGNQPTA